MHEDDDFPDHLHLGDLPEGTVFEDVEGLEKLSLTSVGIDIGSSTSHLVFSRLILRRKAQSTRFEVVDRQVLYQSRILLTPYVSPTLMDVDRLRSFVDATYADAGVRREDVDTGAVVVTGEALNKENARPIAELFARDSGKFICVSAGPRHEGVLAAHGSGCVALSKQRHATVLNVDVGGGTSKLSLVRDGVVGQVAAVSVGARLAAFDKQGCIVRLEQPGRRMLRELGDQADVGLPLDEDRRRDMARMMAGVLFEVMRGGELSPLARELLVTEPLADYGGLREVDSIVFSGGVSEYVYEHDRVAYGDLGPLLGAEIHARLHHTGLLSKVREPAEGIRATVIGAGEYTIQASGVTSYISDERVLPVFGLKVVKALVDGTGSINGELEAALRKFDRERFDADLALALAIAPQPTYPLLRSLAEAVAGLAASSEAPDAPLFLLLDVDVAKSLGGILREELGMARPIIALDGIDVGDLDYVDVGRRMGVSESLPVTVKSLTFPAG